MRSHLQVWKKGSFSVDATKDFFVHIRYKSQTSKLDSYQTGDERSAWEERKKGLFVAKIPDVWTLKIKRFQVLRFDVNTIYLVPTFHNLLVNFITYFYLLPVDKSISFTNLLTYLRLVRQMSFREIGIFKHSILRKTSSIHFLCVKLFRLGYVHYEIMNFTHYSKRIRGQVDELEIPPTNFLQNCKFGQRRSFLIPYYVFTS